MGLTRKNVCGQPGSTVSIRVEFQATLHVKSTLAYEIEPSMARGYNNKRNYALRQMTPVRAKGVRDHTRA